MLLLNPRLVQFGPHAWDDVAAVTIDRAAARLAEEWGDLGPHAAFADVPELRTTIRIVQELLRDDLDAPLPGTQDELTLHTSPAWADGGRRKLTARAIITRIEHEVSLKRGAIRTITLLAISEDGADDPITFSEAAP